MNKRPRTHTFKIWGYLTPEVGKEFNRVKELISKNYGDRRVTTSQALELLILAFSSPIAEVLANMDFDSAFERELLKVKLKENKAEELAKSISKTFRMKKYKNKPTKASLNKKGVS